MKVTLLPGTGERVELTSTGVLERYAIYKFMLDDYGPFEYAVSKQEDTIENLKAAIRAKETILEEATAPGA